ncbi:response regulator [Massilia niabensis]|uniref:Response regulator n=1 Tax=Massilia niabensis TaxID=544910 RepID=A0ABW0L5H1_9BURK
MNHVLLIDDDTELVGMLSEYLEQEGFAVGCAHDGAAGAREALSGRFAIAVLDVMMPALNGIDTLRRIRAQSRIPILMLTGRGDDADRILGLELGADDYVTKPCTPRELTARVRAILRRTHDAQPAGANAGAVVHAVGKLTVLPEQRRATWDGATLELTSTEFNLLEVLARHAGRPVSKGELSEQGLGRPLARFDRNIDVHLSSLRHKLGLLEDGRSPLQTVYRLGYQLIRD